MLSVGIIWQLCQLSFDALILNNVCLFFERIFHVFCSWQEAIILKGSMFLLCNPNSFPGLPLETNIPDLV